LEKAPKTPRYHSAQRDTDDLSAIEAERVHETDRIGGHIVKAALRTHLQPDSSW
jgi:hypothetical protein